jgi:LysM repeat protein
VTHTVARGESASLIAQKYGVTTNDLLAANGLSRKSVLKVGQKLNVKGGGSVQTASAPKAQPITHKVARGESASVIAQKYGVSTSDLLAANGLSRKSVLKVGQKLTVYPKGAAMAKASDEERIEHKVSKGDSPWKIARRYNVSQRDLYQWNNWSGDPVLSVGSTVVVFR